MDTRYVYENMENISVSEYFSLDVSADLLYEPYKRKNKHY